MRTPNRTIPIGLAAFYGAIVLGLSYYIRHRFSILVYVLAVWHTFIYGSNVWFSGYQRPHCG